MISPEGTSPQVQSICRHLSFCPQELSLEHTTGCGCKFGGCGKSVVVNRCSYAPAQTEGSMRSRIFVKPSRQSLTNETNPVPTGVLHRRIVNASHRLVFHTIGSVGTQSSSRGDCRESSWRWSVLPWWLTCLGHQTCTPRESRCSSQLWSTSSCSARLVFRRCWWSWNQVCHTHLCPVRYDFPTKSWSC